MHFNIIPSRRRPARRLARTRMLASGLLLAAWLPALPASAADGAVAIDTEPDATVRRPLVTAPRLAGSLPVVDGRVGKEEWSRAARSAPLISHLTGLKTAEEAVYWVAYSADALHVAFRFHRPPHAAIPGENDLLELMVSPQTGVSTDFNFAVGLQGAVRSATRSGGMTKDRAWRPDWSAAARTIADGWEGEVRIPFASLGVKMPAPGELWDLQVVRNRRTPDNEMGYASFQTGWRARDQFARLRFGGPGDLVVSLLSAGALNVAECGGVIEILGGDARRDVSLQLALYRPDARAEKVTVVASEVVGDDVMIPEVREANLFEQIDERGWPAVLAAHEEVGRLAEDAQLEPGQLRRFPLTVKTPPGRFLLVYRVTEKAGGRLLAGGALPFEQRVPFDVEVQPCPLVAKAVAVTAGYVRLGEAVRGGRIEAELIDPATGNVLQSVAEATSTNHFRSLLMLPFPAGGEFGRGYDVQVRLRDAGGRMIGEHRAPIRLKERPEWLDNTIGITEDPLPGWGPIRLQGDDLARVDLREYRLGGAGLPAAIRSRDKELLAAPVTLSLGGTSPVWQRTLAKQGAGKVRWEARAATDGLAWRLTTTLEYDGLLRYDLTLTPEKGPVNLRDLVLRIPYRRDRARVGAEARYAEFQPSHQIGDFDTGLFWFCEWAKGWQIGAKPAMELAAAGDVVDWQVRFIGAEGRTLGEPLTLTWGLQALPVRKLDRHVQYENRRVNRVPPSFTEGDVKLADLSENWLEYPAKGHLEPDEGALVVRINAGGYNMRLVRIGDGEDAVNISFESSRLSGGQKLTLHRGGETVGYRWSETGLLARTGLFIHRGWIPVGLSWRRDGDTVLLQLVTQDHAGGVRQAGASLPAADWSRILAADRLILGGAGTVTVDSVLALRRAPAPTALAALFNARPAGGADFTLIDPIGKIRFSRSRYMTRPILSADGRGGIAGARWGGSFVRSVAGDWDAAVLLPSRELNVTPEDVVVSYRAGIIFPDFTQWGFLAGFYGTAFAPSPSYLGRIRSYRQKGLNYMFYGDMGLEPDLNADIGPFMQELARWPIKRTFTALTTDFADQPTQDYYVWGWKKTIDYYGVNSIHMDNTISLQENENPFTGHGWTDEAGAPRGRWAFFGAREAAKRFRWLHHVHTANGVLSLHAGARRYPCVSGFADVHQCGEGQFYMGGDIARRLILPEEWIDGYMHQVGVPVEVLTKRGRQDWGPNFIYLYALLFDMDIRNFGSFFHPSLWHVDPARPDASTMGEYDPYFARVGVPEQSTPQVLLWQLKDEFGTREAEFRPFWDNGGELTLNGSDRLRSSFYLHRGASALFVLSNFSPEAVDAEMHLNLEALGLAGRPLLAYDAFTDAPYALEGNRIGLKIPGASYRLIRVEKK